MITGLGVDIVEIDRMRRGARAPPAHEGAALLGRGARVLRQARNRPEVHYALRFAAKEAVLKALGTGFSGMRFTRRRGRARRARPAGARGCRGRAAERAAELGVVEMHLSLSFTHTTAVASAVAITEDARPRKDERPDPKARAGGVVQGGAGAARRGRAPRTRTTDGRS